MYELNLEDLEAVEGGNFVRLVFEAFKNELVSKTVEFVTDLGTDAFKVAGDWFMEKAPGGADEGLWIRTGQSQMGS